MSKQQQKKIDQLKLEIEKNRENEDAVQLELNLKSWKKLQKTTTKLEILTMAEMEMYKNNLDKASELLLEALRKDKTDQEVIILFGICSFKRNHNQMREILKIMSAINKGFSLENITSKRECLLYLNGLSLKVNRKNIPSPIHSL